MAAPTLAALPLTCDTVRVSPSGSVSFVSTPFAASTVSVTPWSVPPSSLTAVGVGFLTSHAKSCETEAPLLSVAVMVTTYRPSAPPCDAERSSVPVMMPVAGSMVSPGGRPEAEYVSTSPLSTSVNWPEMSTGVIAWPSLLFWLARMTSGISVGASLVPVIVTVSVAVDVPPSPSETV